MNFQKLAILVLVLFFVACDDDGGGGENIADCLSVNEKALYDLMMDYRSENGLPSIPISSSLTRVAQLHAKDLTKNFTSFDEDCNLHSWGVSDDGSWNDCCYDDAHSIPECMWDKPREMTLYEGNGYEIVAWTSLGTEAFLEEWKKSESHNNLIVNQDIWTAEWKAIGIGVDGIYATAWFGHNTDLDGTSDLCP